MKLNLPALRRAIALIAVVLAPITGHAAVVSLFVPYEGAGNVSVFDAAAGTGGWTGSIEQSAFPAVPQPLSLVSVVLFQLDGANHSLVGSFEFTTTDLASSVFGELSGSYVNDDILSTGGQFSIDYTVLGGSGDFLGASGYGLAFLDFDPAGSFNNYAESGLLNIDLPQAVPEPASLALCSVALLALGWERRLAARVGRRRAVQPVPSRLGTG